MLFRAGKQIKVGNRSKHPISIGLGRFRPNVGVSLGNLQYLPQTISKTETLQS